MPKIIIIANTGFALFNFRLPLMYMMQKKGWEVVALACDEADYSSKIGNEGFRFINLDMDHKGKNPIADLIFTWRLKNILKKEKPDIVHYFTIKPVIFGSIAAKLAGIKAIVNTITGLGYVFDKEGILNTIALSLYKIAFSGRPQVIFQNHDDRDLFLSKQTVREKQSHVILGSGVDCTRLQRAVIKKKTNLSLLLVARMLWSKGIVEYVTAAEKIRAEFPNTVFIMAGGASGGGAAGNPQMIPEKWLHEVQDRGNVQWTGRVPPEKIYSLLDNSDIAVLPSYYREGVPKALLEASAKGRAIITTNTPGCREVVVDGLNGYLVPPHDSEALTKAIRKLINNPELVQKMGQESRKRAEKLFDEKVVLEQTFQVYQKAMHL